MKNIDYVFVGFLVFIFTVSLIGSGLRLQNRIRCLEKRLQNVETKVLIDNCGSILNNEKY